MSADFYSAGLVDFWSVDTPRRCLACHVQVHAGDEGSRCDTHGCYAVMCWDHVTMERAEDAPQYVDDASRALGCYDDNVYARCPAHTTPHLRIWPKTR